ncbi:MAG: hypothetical protein UHM85_00275 [Acutalibacteraceae bacterium]|nr:hypothetical protein [Acutalibacteraceae bacterium]
MKKIVAIASALIIAFVVYSVTDFYDYVKEPEKLPIPDITTFSDTELEERENKLPELDKAILHLNGKQQEISKDDSRLIRLLNFCTYSQNIGLSMWTISTDYNNSKDDIEDGDRLEIFFKNVESTYIGFEFDQYDRFVVKENMIWLIQSNPKYEIWDGNKIGSSVWFPCGARCEGWRELDILGEAGFLMKTGDGSLP